MPSPGGFSDREDYRLGLVEDLAVRKPEHSVTLLSQVGVAVLIDSCLLSGLMDASIDLDNQTDLMAIEVNDEFPDLVLTAELQPELLTISK